MTPTSNFLCEVDSDGECAGCRLQHPVRNGVHYDDDGAVSCICYRYAEALRDAIRDGDFQE